MSPSLRARQPRIATVGLVALVAVASAFAATAVWRFAGTATSAGASSTSSWLVLASDRAGGEYTLGEGQAYLLRPNGSRLTSLLGTESRLTPVDVSANGRSIAYKNADGNAVYVSRSDGTGLSRVLAPGHGQLGQEELAPDGDRVAITRADSNDHPRLVVVDVDSRHLHRLGRAASPDWSPNGKLLVFATFKGCAVAAEPFTAVKARIRGRCGYPTFSPDGQSVAFQTKSRCAVVRTPAVSALGRLARLAAFDRRILLAGSCAGPLWSPDGRWIAYQSPGCPYCDSEKRRRAALKDLGVWVVRPDGSGRHRVGPAGEEEGASYSWSPDSRRLAITAGSRLVVVTLDGRRTRVHGLDAASDSYSAPLWSPDGGRLTLAAQKGDDPPQVWSVRPDGKDQRRLTSAGVNDLLGVARALQARSPAPALPPSERMLGPRLLGTAKPIGRLAADGSSVAYAAGSTETDCEHISVWTPSARTMRRVWPRIPAPCSDDYATDSSFYELALAGSMVGWSINLGCGNSGCGVEVHSARLPEADPTLVDEDDGADYGNEFLRPFDPVGRGGVFAVEDHVRVVLPGGRIRRCRLPGQQDAESVDRRRIAVGTGGGELVVDDRCAVVSRIPLVTKGLHAVLLDGTRLLAFRRGIVDAYDIASRRLVLQRPVPLGTMVDGAAAGLVVYHRARTITALRLEDGRSVSFRPCHGPVGAAIADRGLYYSYTTAEREGRLAMVPRRELDRRLAAGTSYEPRCVRSAENFATGGAPASLAVADLNGDGQPDVVTANESGHGLSVLLHGAGMFEARRDYPTGSSPYSLAVGDLDGDGDPDLASAARSGKSVTVLLNRGDGTFGAARRDRGGHVPAGLVIGDLDGDGKPDLALVNEQAGSVSVLLNRGDGSFGPQNHYAAGSYPLSVAIGDVTGDGRADLVIGHSVDNRSVSVLPGTGDGSFGHRRSFAAGEETADVALADLDGDGTLDIVAASRCRVLALLNRGGGSFAAAHDLGSGVDCPDRLAIADLDGDGRPDVVATGNAYAFPSTVSVFLNRGGGRFGTPRDYESGGKGDDPGDVAIGDVNGDGSPDIVRANYDANAVAVLSNTLGVCHLGRVRGHTEAAVRASLGRFRCRVGRVTRAYSKGVRRGRVIAAEPRFGAFWPNGPEVGLLVSLGRKR
jgi:Tol biopolymer transport system component